MSLAVAMIVGLSSCRETKTVEKEVEVEVKSEDEGTLERIGKGADKAVEGVKEVEKEIDNN